MSTRVSLAELAASDIRLRPAEAVAIVSAICEQHMSGTLPGIPSPGVIRLTRNGEVVAEGPMTTAHDDVSRAAMLLTDLLSGFDALPEYRASGALRLVLARALGSVDLPPYASLADFCLALSRFRTEDVRDVSQGLFTAWERARAARAFKAAPDAELTISDVRRARRATGLSLGYLAVVAEVAPARLRDLEWGYMRHWPATSEGRAQVIRYARAAGLDESVVLSIAWPMILERASDAGADTVPGVALVRSGPQVLTVVQPRLATGSARTRHWRAALVAAAATVALIGAFAFGWRSSQPEPPRYDGLQVGVSAEGSAPGLLEPADRRASRVAMPIVPRGDVSQSSEPRFGVTRAVVMQDAEVRDPLQAQESAIRRAQPPPVAAAKPKTRRASAPPQGQEPRKPSILQRELFRIVFR